MHVLGHLVYRLHNWSKVCWPTQSNSLNSFLVCIDNACQAVNFRIKDVAVEREAVACVIMARDPGTIT